MTLGGTHGPIEETYDLLKSEDMAAMVNEILDGKRKVPGWGSSFDKDGQGDPNWKPVDALLLKHFEPYRWRMTTVTNTLHESGILVLPNPSAYTAITALILQMPKKLAPYILVMGRLSAWAEIFLNETKGS